MSTSHQKLIEPLGYLQLAFIREHFEALAQQAAKNQGAPTEYLVKLIDGEVQRRQDLALQRRIKATHFPLLKTLDAFQWHGSKAINRMQVQQLFRLAFIDQHQRHLRRWGRISHVQLTSV